VWVRECESGKVRGGREKIENVVHTSRYVVEIEDVVDMWWIGLVHRLWMWWIGLVHLSAASVYICMHRPLSLQVRATRVATSKCVCATSKCVQCDKTCNKRDAKRQELQQDRCNKKGAATRAPPTRPPHCMGVRVGVLGVPVCILHLLS